MKITRDMLKEVEPIVAQWIRERGTFMDGASYGAALELAAYVSARRTTPDREAWQPIETAPKDGTPLVMFARYVHATASIVLIAAWLEDYGMWVNQSFSCAPIQQVVPSHWMARPEFPTDAARAGDAS
ncbi:hypothetical protein LGN30_32035 [Burkholderia seminalis]|uniref:hypothetical protein n=1 Tax=Burkholderia seminalis TaxID=488731 RepID=UPI001CF4A9E6|nr:hypothetical protein [Burkholderia seminalis]MCA8427819.1 hypothetical protein [Burkholderia seminalis]